MSFIGRTGVGVTLLLLAIGCSAVMSSFQSSFFSNFSVKELVEKNKSAGGLNCSPGGGGGGIGTGSGGIGQKQSNFLKSESFSCQLTDAEQFDEAKFLQVLKASIEKDLTDSKAKIVNSKDPDATGFYVEYTIGDTTGKVEISSTRGALNYYTLHAELRETRGNEK